MSDIEKVKKLREVTGAGFKDCNLAIKENVKTETNEKTKTVQELDREKLEKKFSKEGKEKLN